MDEIKIVGSITVGVLIIVAGIILLFNSWVKTETSKACLVFDIESNYTTRYVEYTYWNVDCLVEMENGKWISVYNLRGE